MLMDSLTFALRIVAKLLCSCVLLFDVIVELCTIYVEKKCSMTFSLKNKSEFYM
jgi:hypothetical protein